MKAPDKIYVNIPGDYWHPGTDEKVNTDTEYIRKDALLEWAKETKEIMSLGGHVSIDDIISKIESL